MRTVVGLGNPGSKYAQTRHNLGFWVVDRLAGRYALNGWKNEHKAEVAKGMWQGTGFLLAKPQTYMNLSGESVVPLLNYYRTGIEDLLVVVDDLELPPGKVRTRDKGSHGGHNGLRNIIQLLGSADFKRIRVGIGRPQPGQSVTGHVLGANPQEAEALEEATQVATDLASRFIEYGEFENWSSP